jgi:hypothetical protein
MAVTFTQKAADRISRAVKWVEQQIRTQGPSEGTVTPRSVEPTYVLTTSGTATSGFYPGKVVLYSAADAAWQEYTTCKILPANGETLTNNTRYAARYTGRNSGGDGVFTVLQGGGGLTAEEVDGSPSYTGVTKLQFDQADGFVLSNPATGTTRVDIQAATASQAGIVSTTTQTFGGDKTFNNTVTVKQAFTGESTGTIQGALYAWNNAYVNDTLFIGGSSGSGPYMRIKGDGTNSRIRMSYGDNTTGCLFRLTGVYTDMGLVPDSSNVPLIGMLYNTSSTFSNFYCDSKPGLTGTLKSNAVATGGIITNLGNTSVQSSSWMGF